MLLVSIHSEAKQLSAFGNLRR